MRDDKERERKEEIMKVFIIESPLWHLFLLHSDMAMAKRLCRARVIYGRIISIPCEFNSLVFLEKSIFIDLFYGLGLAGSSATGNIVEPIYAVVTVVIACKFAPYLNVWL